MHTLLVMFLEFFKTGLFAVGGGLATIPFLMDISDKYGWFSQSELANMIAVAESTPGPIGVNTATYAGVTTYGIVGGLIATFGLVLPSYIVIVIVYKVLERFKENKLTQTVFYGLRPAVAGLITVAAYSLLETTVFPDLVLNIKALVMLLVFTLLVLSYKKLNPIAVIALGAIVGILFKI